MLELGQTNDPESLVPGDVGAVADTMWQLRTYGDSLQEAGAGLERVDTTDGWKGAAADAFRKVFHGQPGKWAEAGVCFHDAANALDSYDSTLHWAQGQAGSAIQLWNEGVAAGSRAAQDRGRYGRGRSGQGAGQSPTQARILVATRLGPGRFFGTAGHDLEAVGAGAVDSLASLGNAALNHPADLAGLVGGLGLAAVSGTADAGGAVLDATGVGAIVGVPVNVVSTAGVIAGLGAAAAATGDLMHYAATDDQVSPVRADSSGSSGSGDSGPTKTDRLKEHLTDRDLDAARRELDGEVVARKPDGTPWDHVDEVQNAQRGLINRIAQINRQLGDSRISSADRAALNSELSEASRLLDYSEQFVPRN